MGKRLKIVVIGLPLFAKRIVKDLSEFDKENKEFYAAVFSVFNTMLYLNSREHETRFLR